MSPHAKMRDLLTGYWVTQALHVAARLGLADHLKDGPRTAEALASATGTHAPSLYRLLRALAGVNVLADVGGGNGSLLTAVLNRYPKMQGILFDLPGVIERAKANLAGAGLAGRCQCVGGDFFQAVVPGADAYLMRHIIHDW